MLDTHYPQITDNKLNDVEISLQEPISKINLSVYTDRDRVGTNHFREHNHNAMAEFTYESLKNMQDCYDKNLFIMEENPCSL